MTGRSKGWMSLSVVAYLWVTGCGDDGQAAQATSDTDTGTDTSGDTDGTPAAQWVEHSCAMAIPSGLAASDFTCGTLTVPQSWDAPTDTVVTIEVAILLAEDPQTRRPDPFVFFGGGPGAWNLEGYLPAQAVTVLRPIRRTRDIVFFDQRGNGLSSPSLFCPEYDEAFVQSFSVDADTATDARTWVEGHAACRDRLESEGVMVEHFDSYHASRDVAALMDALEYESYNLYGISYGGRMVQTMMRVAPDRVRSAVLDSTVMPEISFAAGFPANFDRAVEVMAEQCAASERCGDSYPDLKATLAEAIAVLNETPHVSTLPGPDGSSMEIVINGDRFVLGIQSAMYRADLIPLLPAAIGGAAAGQTSLLDAFAPALVSTGGFDWGLYAAILCSEVLPFDTPQSLDAARQGLDPTLADPLFEANGGYFLDMCDLWGVPPRPEEATAPVVSDIPTLILAGNYDPATPPSNGEKAAENLSNGQFVLFNGLGHGILRSDPPPVGEDSCAQRIVTTFLDDPMAPVDTTCATSRPGPFD